MAVLVGIFSVEGTSTQVSYIKNAVNRCTYPLDNMLPAMNGAGYTKIRVRFLPGGDPIFQGRFWAYAQTFSACTISVRNDIPERATKVMFIHEVGHFADAFYLNNTRRRRIHRYYHYMDPAATANPNHGWFDPDPGTTVGATPYHREQQEGFASDFIDLFSDLDSTSYQSTYSHTLVSSRYQGARDLVLTGVIGEEPPGSGAPPGDEGQEPEPDAIGSNPYPPSPCG
jgi:hypothetical protein